MFRKLYCIVSKSFYSCVQTKDERTWHLSQLDTHTELSGIPSEYGPVTRGAHRCSTPFYCIIHLILRPAHTCSDNRTPTLLTNQGRTLNFSPVPAS